MANLATTIQNNEVLAKVISVMTDEGEYCTFKAFYGLIVSNLKTQNK